MELQRPRPLAILSEEGDLGTADRGPGRRGWLDRWLTRLLGEDAGWVLGDLQERRGRRRGLHRVLAGVRDVLSVARWALGRRTAGRASSGLNAPCASRRVAPWVEGGWQDLRHAAAGLRRDGTFVVVVTLTLAIGIGANTAVFSVVHSTLLKPLPYEEPARLATVWTDIPSQGVHGATSSRANIRDWKAQGRVFEDLATFDPSTQTLTGGPWPEQVAVAYVSENLFSVLGVSPAAGRSFSAEEVDRRVPVALASHGLWQRLYESSSPVGGQVLEVNRRAFEVIGVMPEGFGFPGTNTEVWLPETAQAGWDAGALRRGTDSWRVVGRLAPGETPQRARSDLNAVADRLEAAHPRENAGLDVSVVPLLDQVTGSSYRTALWTLLWAVGLVLLIACANAAQLVLARTMRRIPELSLRVTLGASTQRLIRLTLSEALLISVGACVSGLALAALGVRVFTALAPASLPRLGDVGIELPVLFYATGVSLVTGAILGIAPISGRLSRALHGGSREGPYVGPGAHGLGARRLLVVGQFALAIVLVFGANLLIRSLAEVGSVEPGFRSDDVLMANLSAESPADRAAFYARVLERVGAIPGVRDAALVEDLFISGAPNRPVTVEAPVVAEPVFEELRVDAVAGAFFRTVAAPLLEGRAFSTADDAAAPPVAIVNETMARRLWPGESAVSKRLRLGDSGSGAPWIEVVGVVGDMRRQGLERPPVMQAFRPYEQAPSRNMNLLVRTSGSVPGLGDALRTAIAAVDRSVPLYRVTTVAATLDLYVVQRRFQTLLLGIFSAIALVLAGIGVYGLSQHSVEERTREIGVRMALGARSSGVVAMVLRQGLGPALVGSAAGVGLAVLLSKAASALLFGVTPADPGNLLLTPGILLLTTLLACYLPARRAARIDPMQALRDG